MHWIYFIPNQSFINILHGYKTVRLTYYAFRRSSVDFNKSLRLMFLFESNFRQLMVDIFPKSTLELHLSIVRRDPLGVALC